VYLIPWNGASAVYLTPQNGDSWVYDTPLTENLMVGQVLWSGEPEQPDWEDFSHKIEEKSFFLQIVQ